MSRRIAACLTLLAVAACGTSGTDEEGMPVAAAASVPGHDLSGLPEAIDALEILNGRLPASDLLTGGQLTEEQFAALHQMGYGRFINLRLADENGTGWEEEYAAREGIDFVRFPVGGSAGITQENGEHLAQLLAEAGDGPVVVYCGSGNRVGALLALKAYHTDGMSAEDALSFGLEAGLTRLEPRVREELGLEN